MGFDGKVMGCGLLRRYGGMKKRSDNERSTGFVDIGGKAIIDNGNTLLGERGRMWRAGIRSDTVS